MLQHFEVVFRLRVLVIFWNGKGQPRGKRRTEPSQGKPSVFGFFAKVACGIRRVGRQWGSIGGY